jgi:DNA-binding beta-propeller fold protein YncE
MIRLTLTIPIALAGGLLLATDAHAAEVQMVWQAQGLDAPESAVLDESAGVIYVSNVNGNPMEADGNGYIAKLSTDGKILDKHWVTGLNGPTGLALHDGKLYAADINKLVVVDTASGRIVATYDALGAKFLNDVSAAADGRVFVSGMINNQIWVLDGPIFGLWLQNPALETPNGLLAAPDRLLVASWGKDMNLADFSTKVPGHLKAVDYQTKAITDLGTAPIGNLDGLEPDGKGSYLVTDWMAGALYRIDASGKATMLMDLNQGSADLHYVPSEQLAIIPMMMDNAVVAYKVE